MHTIQSWPIFPLIPYILLLLGLLSLSRGLLMAWLFKRVGNPRNAVKIAVLGLRFDIILICYLWLIPAMLLLLLPEYAALNMLIITTAKYWFGISTVLVVFMEISTPAFIDQFDTRPNRLFFEYFDSPGEIIRTSVLEYPWHFVAAIILMTALIYSLAGFNQYVFAALEPFPVWLRLVLLPVLLVVTVLGGRSTFGHRPVNASMAAFTNDQLLNKLGLSSTYTVLDALVRLKDEESGTDIYGKMDDVEMVDIVRQHMNVDPAAFIDDPLSTWHRQAVTEKRDKPNLVIILEESMGAGFSKKMGGVGVTPQLDLLSEQGLWFSALYATGTRSARGIEAVVSGFPPSPSRSVLKLGLAQQHFPTLASILGQQGYDTQFIYGGERHFDNMAGFFLANGFDRVTDEKDFSAPYFRGTWGVSDQDLFQRVDEELMQAQDKPQFVLAFTSSNHSPFQFPDGQFELHDAARQTVNNAVKYADFALGQFFDRARSRPYWDNTYFLVVADHDTRVFGASLVPVNKFHIPALILGPDVKPQDYTRLCSQIDLAPTLLSLMGIPGTHPMIGHDLLHLPPRHTGRAMMQYDDNHAYIQEDQAIIHRPRQQPKQFIYRNRELVETRLDEKLAAVARAHALWPMFTYREQKYLSVHPLLQGIGV